MTSITTTITAILSLAYVLGLLFTGIPGSWAGIPLGAILILVAGIGVAVCIRRIWRTAPKAEIWLAAGLVGVLAVLHFHLRLPTPATTDLCHWVSAESAVVAQAGTQVGMAQAGTAQAGTAQAGVTQTKTQPASGQVTCQPSPLANPGVKRFQVTGTVTSPPRLTRSNRLQFELAATQVSPVNPSNPSNSSNPSISPTAGGSKSPRQPVTGQVYVTIPPTAGTQLYPGLTVQVEGTLYKPKPATNPGGFDFEQYLAQQGIFTGLNGQTLLYPSDQKPRPPLFWKMRQQIQQVQAMGLTQPEAALVSAMVMGKSAVNVPYDLQDQFKQTGLAHALAASGTQVSLLVGVMLALTQRFSPKVRFGLGTATLILYLGLTGIEASVLRAGVMGFVALLALTAERKVKPIGSLLFAALVLLFINPLWIWDLGFQLSFLATLGLLVTVPLLTKWLDWMPSTITPMFAVPVAAYIWTLPLMLLKFGIVSPYSILINVIVSPLITLVSIGGMVSAVGALAYPPLGSFLAWLLYYPTHGLIKIAAMGSQLPGSTVAVGTIHPVQALLLYGLVVLVWQLHRLHRYWWMAGLIGLGLVALPMGYAATNLSQVTVLDTSETPVWVIQDQGKTGLIYSGTPKDVQFTVLPFLRQQGINHLDWAVAPRLTAAQIQGWQEILAAAPIDIFYGQVTQPQQAAQPSKPDSFRQFQAQLKTHQTTALPLLPRQKIQRHGVTFEWSQSPDQSLKALQLQVRGQTWLLLDQLPHWQVQTQQVKTIQPFPTAAVISWSGQALSFDLLQRLNPKMAIITDEQAASKTQVWLEQQQVPIHSIAQDGALQWQAHQGFVDLGAQ